MVFAPNPLSLSVPEPAFETWLRDSGYLEILDQRTTDLHRLSTTTKPSEVAAGSGSATTSISPDGVFLSHNSSPASGLSYRSSASTLSRSSPPMTSPGTHQARLRVHENVKRFARNYASLFVLFFACSLYQLPVALIGLISCLALWDVFKISGDRWGLDRYPMIRQTLIRIAQCVTAVILFISNVQLAVFCAFGVSYAAMILHASFRKLTPAKQTAVRGGRRNTARR
ncbi:hypothetical protein DH2020_031728 [Rehmannia glutinosa]|uniref:PRA1 family protein n=1 Tax=Rehmannia glutinosa TaxID=99300 RepID=A0ABR0VHB6_REHGL